MREKIAEALTKVREGHKRKFKQSISIVVNLKNMDMKKAENKIKTEFSLPHQTAKKKIIGVFVDNLIPQMKSLEDVVMIRKDDIDSYRGNKKRMKKLAKQCYCFIAEAPLMPHIGKVFGQVLAVRGKMPKPIPPTSPNVKSLIENARSTIRIALKDAPVVQLSVGEEDMEDEKLIDNIEKVVTSLRNALPRGHEQLRELVIKTTMGKPEKVDLKGLK